jgi:hypothetical protein
MNDTPHSHTHTGGCRRNTIAFLRQMTTPHTQVGQKKTHSLSLSLSHTHTHIHIHSPGQYDPPTRTHSPSGTLETLLRHFIPVHALQCVCVCVCMYTFMLSCVYRSILSFTQLHALRLTHIHTRARAHTPPPGNLCQLLSNRACLRRLREREREMCVCVCVCV